MPLGCEATTEKPNDKLLTQNPLNAIFTPEGNNKRSNNSNFQLTTRTKTEFGTVSNQNRKSQKIEEET